MKNYFKKSVGVLLILIILLYTLIGCSDAIYSKGDSYLGFPLASTINAKVETNKLIFNKNNVVIDFFYGLYCLDKQDIWQAKDNHDYVPSVWDENAFHSQSEFAIYISNEPLLTFNLCNSGSFADYNNVDARLYKYISFEEAFSINYGYTTSGESAAAKKIIYNYSEKLTIPSEFFISSNDYVYIHIIHLLHDIDNDTFNTLSYDTKTLRIKYKSFGNTVILTDD